MARYETVVEDGTVSVATGEDRLEVGDLDAIVDLVGGPAWTISYTDQEKRAHPELDTSDEGLTVDVVDTINAMTFGEAFVETLAAQPADAAVVEVRETEGGEGKGDETENGDVRDREEVVSPRLGLFVGRLLENLEYGLR